MTGQSGDTPLGTVLRDTAVVAAGVERARELVATVDPFVANQSPFDRQARLRLPASVRVVDQPAYLDFLQTQVRPWPEGAIEALRGIVASIAAKFRGLDLHLPATVHLVLTTGEEEGGAAYTRRDDTIVLPAGKVALLGGGDALHPRPDLGTLEDIVIHEFFHLLSKNNPAARRRLYGLVGYRQLDRAVPLPDVAWRGARLADLEITNPDTPVLDVVLDMAPPGSGGPARPWLPVLLANAPYETGPFFAYLEWWLFAVESDGAGGWRVELDANGAPVTLATDDAAFAEAYRRIVGGNFTEEIFHPDEVLAQNFVLVMNQPSLGLLREIAAEIVRA
ncbi:MAG: hypothetical protein ACOCYE_00175 [Pseudomonadota bacterium]